MVSTPASLARATPLRGRVELRHAMWHWSRSGTSRPAGPAGRRSSRSHRDATSPLPTKGRGGTRAHPVTLPRFLLWESWTSRTLASRTSPGLGSALPVAHPGDLLHVRSAPTQALLSATPHSPCGHSQPLFRRPRDRPAKSDPLSPQGWSRERRKGSTRGSKSGASWAARLECPAGGLLAASGIRDGRDSHAAASAGAIAGCCSLACRHWRSSRRSCSGRCLPLDAGKEAPRPRAGPAPSTTGWKRRQQRGNRSRTQAGPVPPALHRRDTRPGALGDLRGERPPLP